jgi:hypothetical protein
MYPRCIVESPCVTLTESLRDRISSELALSLFPLPFPVLSAIHAGLTQWTNVRSQCRERQSHLCTFN